MGLAHVGVVGAGQMGSGIAQVCAAAGLTAFGDSKYRPAPLLKEMVSAGHLGRKSKRGLYSYERAS